VARQNRQKQGRKKNRKWGRNKIKCERYAAQHRRTRNNPGKTLRPSERTPHKGAKPKVR
jgi:hypothetical protein